jgi:hypothetical protein
MQELSTDLLQMPPEIVPPLFQGVGRKVLLQETHGFAFSGFLNKGGQYVFENWYHYYFNPSFDGAQETAFREWEMDFHDTFYCGIYNRGYAGFAVQHDSQRNQGRCSNNNSYRNWLRLGRLLQTVCGLSCFNDGIQT